VRRREGARSRGRSCGLSPSERPQGLRTGPWRLVLGARQCHQCWHAVATGMAPRRALSTMKGSSLCSPSVRRVAYCRSCGFGLTATPGLVAICHDSESGRGPCGERACVRVCARALARVRKGAVLFHWHPPAVAGLLVPSPRPRPASAPARRATGSGRQGHAGKLGCAPLPGSPTGNLKLHHRERPCVPVRRSPAVASDPSKS
jgi:hypothetical protein